jgi:hypothetical protein
MTVMMDFKQRNNTMDDNPDDEPRDFRDERRRVRPNPGRPRINWVEADRREAEVNAVDRAAKLEMPPNKKDVGAGKRRKTRRRKTRRRSKKNKKCV